MIKAQIKKIGLLEIANKIGISHIALTNFLYKPTVKPHKETIDKIEEYIQKLEDSKRLNRMYRYPKHKYCLQDDILVVANYQLSTIYDCKSFIDLDENEQPYYNDEPIHITIFDIDTTDMTIEEIKYTSRLSEQDAQELFIEQNSIPYIRTKEELAECVGYIRTDLDI